MKKPILFATLAAMLMGTSSQAYASGAADIAGGMLGLGALIVLNEATKNSQKKSTTKTRTTTTSEQRELMRDVQKRLNALGYDAGVPDGLTGPRTRAAISAFQLDNGLEPTGKMAPDDMALLYQQSNGGYGAAPGADFGMPAGGAFPTLAAPNATGTQAGAFPALGASPTAPAGGQAGAFPSLGTAPAAGNAQTGNFPTLGAQGGQQSPSAFPTIGAPTAALNTNMPVVDGATPALGIPEPLAFDDEIAKTVYLSRDNQPKLLGFSLGSDAETYTASLEAAGFANCVGTRLALQCDRRTDTLVDTVKVWSSDTDGVWAVARMVQFTEPVQAGFVHDQYSQTYPVLMDEPQLTVSSGEACDLNSHGVPALAALFDQRDSSADVEIPSSLTDIAVKCPVAYELAFNQGNGVVAATQTVFFDGTSVLRQQVRAADAKKSQIGADLKF